MTYLVFLIVSSTEDTNCWISCLPWSTQIMASSSHPTEHVDESCREGYSSDDDLAGFKSSLYNRLDQVKTAGSFATAGQCSTLPLPALSVKEYGLVGLPLTENSAKSIINVCHRAPYGKGTLQRWKRKTYADHELIVVQAVKPLLMSQYVRHGSSIRPISNSSTQTRIPACKGQPVLRRTSWVMPRALR